MSDPIGYGIKRILLAVLLVVLSAAAVIGYARARAKWQQRVDELQTQVDSTDVLLEGYAADSAAWEARRDSLDVRDSLLALDEARMALSADSLERERKALLATLDSSLAQIDTVRIPRPIRTVLDQYARALRKLDEERQVCENRRLNAEGRLADCNEKHAIDSTQVADLTVLRDRLRSERDSALALLKPPPILQFVFEGGIGTGCATNFVNTVCGVDAHITVLKFRIPWP